MRPYLRVANVFEDRIDISDVMVMNFTPEEFEIYQLQEGDILLNEGQSKELVGRPAMYRGEIEGCCFTNTLVRFQAGPMIDRRFALYQFRYWLRTGAFSAIANVTTNIAHLGAGRLAAMEIAIPPSGEQRRITAKLDVLFAQSAKVRLALTGLDDLLHQYRNRVLERSLLGEQGRGRKPARSLDHHRGVGTVESLDGLRETGRVITYGVVKLGEEVADGVPCLRTSNVRWLRIETEGLKRIARGLSEQYGRTVLRGGEVLVNVRGTLGGVAVATDAMAGWNVSREVAVVPVDKTRVVPAFLALWIASPRSQAWLRSVEKGVAYTGINIEDLRSLPVELPSIAEQHEIVRRIEAAFVRLDAVAATVRVELARLDALDRALFSRAFRGELVPQDPADEPASELLARLQKEPPDMSRKGPRAARQPQALRPQTDPPAPELPPVGSGRVPPVDWPTFVAQQGTDGVTVEQLYRASGLWVDAFYSALRKCIDERTLREERRTDAVRIVAP